MLKFALVGTGYRSEFYAKASISNKSLELVCWLCRNEEKLNKLHDKYGLHTSICEEEMLNLNPDFIVVCVDKQSILKTAIYYAKKGFPILMETPCALSYQDIEDYNNAIKDGLKIQVAEQYIKTPYISCLINEINSNIIGEVESLTLSYAHDYHAISIAREILKSRVKNICGSSYIFKTTRYKDRYNTYHDGLVIDSKEVHLTLEYYNKKVLFYNFTSEEYRSPIRNRYINVRGSRGEIINDIIYYLDNDNIFKTKKIKYNHKIDGDLYAIKKILLGMKKYIKYGIEIYNNNNALEDSYISIKMAEAIPSNKKIECEDIKWISQ